MPDRTRARLKRWMAEAASRGYRVKRRVAETMSVRNGVWLKWCLAVVVDGQFGRWLHLCLAEMLMMILLMMMMMDDDDDDDDDDEDDDDADDGAAYDDEDG